MIIHEFMAPTTLRIAARLLAPRFCPQQKADITSIPVKLILIKPATLHIYMVRLHEFTPAVGMWGRAT